MQLLGLLPESFQLLALGALVKWPSISIPLGLGALGAIIGVIGDLVGGYTVTAIIALLNNWLAPRIGGVKVELARRQNVCRSISSALRQTLSLERYLFYRRSRIMRSNYA